MYERQAMKRFHLSTLLLLTVLGGAFIGANLQPRAVAYSFNNWNDVHFAARGFPFICARLVGDGSGKLSWSIEGTVAANIAIAIAALALGGYVSEKIARRKKNV